MPATSTRVSSSSCAEPLPKRHATGEAVAGVSGHRQSAAAAQGTVLHNDQIRSIISAYLTVTELVAIRRVSSEWSAQFSAACCWTNSYFEQTNLQLYATEHNRITVDVKPHLAELKLLHSDHLEAYTQHMVEQLARGSNTSLTKLTLPANLTAAAAAALPSLQHLVIKLPNNLSTKPVQLDTTFIQHLPSTLKSLQVHEPNDHGTGAKFVDELIKHPLPLLEEVGHCEVTPAQVQQLVALHTCLTSVDFRIETGQECTAIATELRVAISLTELTLCCPEYDHELVEPLCRLPRILKLHISPDPISCIASIGFWQGIPAVRASKVEHLPADQRHQQSQLVQLNIVSPSGVTVEIDDIDDEVDKRQWWLAALKASWSCNNFEGVRLPRISQQLWQQLFAETEGQSSVLQCIRHQRMFTNPARLLKPYILKHTALTELHLIEDNGLWTDTATVLPHLPLLTKLELDLRTQASLATITQAMQTIGSASKLRHLVVATRAPQLPGKLQLIKAAALLTYAKLGGLSSEFADLQLADIRDATKHVQRLDMYVADTQDAAEHVRNDVARKLLSLHNLHRLSLPASASFSYAEMAALRRAAGLTQQR